MLAVDSLSPNEPFSAVDSARRLALQELYCVLSDCYQPAFQK